MRCGSYRSSPQVIAVAFDPQHLVAISGRIAEAPCADDLLQDRSTSGVDLPVGSNARRVHRRDLSGLQRPRMGGFQRSIGTSRTHDFLGEWPGADATSRATIPPIPRV